MRVQLETVRQSTVARLEAPDRDTLVAMVEETVSMAVGNNACAARILFTDKESHRALPYAPNCF